MRASMVSPTTTLNSLPLPPSALELLAATDFVTVADLDGLTAQDLAEELSSSERPVTTEHAARLLLMVRSGGFGDDAHMAATSSGMAVAASAAGGASLSSSALHFPAARSALSLLREERASRRIITFARELDELLGGGVAPKMLTEFAGAPGVGKTQVAMQLALNAQIPPSFGGVGGRSAYIDSEGSFLAPRCLQMAEALVRFLHAAATTDQQRADANALQPRAMLDAILVYRVHDALEQLPPHRAASEVASGRGGQAGPSGTVRGRAASLLVVGMPAAVEAGRGGLDRVPPAAQRGDVHREAAASRQDGAVAVLARSPWHRRVRPRGRGHQSGHHQGQRRHWLFVSRAGSGRKLGARV